MFWGLILLIISQWIHRKMLIGGSFCQDWLFFQILVYMFKALPLITQSVLILAYGSSELSLDL